MEVDWRLVCGIDEYDWLVMVVVMDYIDVMMFFIDTRTKKIGEWEFVLFL